MKVIQGRYKANLNEVIMTSLQEVIKWSHEHTQGAEVTRQLRVNGKIRHLRRTLEDQSLALKRKHRVHKNVNTASICVSVMNLFILL